MDNEYCKYAEINDAQFGISANLCIKIEAYCGAQNLKWLPFHVQAGGFQSSFQRLEADDRFLQPYEPNERLPQVLNLLLGAKHQIQ